ncbi:murein L,D-transpeptidase catalytic domain family protein [Neorhizobium sp. NCHU2750]|uniref:murein L,D-transpeptidase catalytic domain family protein n=1 Tax=Neorhizobium sp. NCHU2750 TaxID=1825976 RepID=UPI001FDF65E7
MLTAVSAQAASAQHLPPAPEWLKGHIGEGDGQIAPTVFERARALYFSKVAEGKVKNPCYFAMDATRPNDLTDGKAGGRFYTICEASQTFSVISSGHGSGRKLPGVVDFSNDRACARNFGNALDSNLTAGGAYLTSEIKTSFKGYYRTGSGGQALLTRSFVQFDGVGETANARQRAIGGHAAALVSGICMQKKPESPYANRDGYVPLGKLVNYAGGRSDGCTSWSPAEAPMVLSTVKDNPTTVYIYPESRDIAAMSKALASGRPGSHAGVYWNSDCLKEIGTPRFWNKETLEPLIAQYKKDHPAPPPKPVPICDPQMN